MSAIRSQIGPRLFWEEVERRPGDEFRYLGKLHRVVECWAEGSGFCYTTEVIS